MIFAWKNIEQEVSGAVKDLGNWCQLFTGHEINFFFSNSHLAPKFKVEANSKKVGHHLQRQTKPFLCCQHSRKTLQN